MITDDFVHVTNLQSILNAACLELVIIAISSSVIVKVGFDLVPTTG